MLAFYLASVNAVSCAAEYTNTGLHTHKCNVHSLAKENIGVLSCRTA